MSSLPARITPRTRPRRAILVFLASVLTMIGGLATTPGLANAAVATGALTPLAAQEHALPGCSSSNFGTYDLAVPGATSPGVTVDNLSCYLGTPGHNLDTLIYRADEGLVSRTPESTNAPGLMANGDVVVVTDYTIFWISVSSSLGTSDGRDYTGSGLIAGEWPIGPGTPGSNQPVFAATVGPNHWAPNWLLPASTGNGLSTLVTGLGVRVVPDCGTDASSTPGTGTFIIEGTPDQSSMRILPPPASDPHEHRISFTGFLEQEDTPGDTTMTDCEGHSGAMQFSLTYVFYDALDPALAYGGVTTETRLNQVQVAIRSPQSDMVIRDFGVGDDLQTEGGGLPIPETMSDTSDALQRYAAPGDPCKYADASFPAGALVSVCAASPSSGQPSTEIQESTGLLSQDNPPVHNLPVGNIAAFTSSNDAYSLSYLHPADSSPLLPPLRDSLVWNTSLGGVAAVETQFVGELDNPVILPKGKTVTVAQDQDLAQDLNPPKPATLEVSPGILPAAGGKLAINASTLAGYEMTTNPPLAVTTGASSRATVVIPANNTGSPITYTFDLSPTLATPDAPPPTKVVQAAAPVAVFTSQAGALPAAPLELNGAASFEHGGTIDSYLWHFGDGGTAGGPIADHVFPAPGTYDVSLTVTDSRGQQATSAQMVTVGRAGHMQRHVIRPGAGARLASQRGSGRRR